MQALASDRAQAYKEFSGESYEFIMQDSKKTRYFRLIPHQSKLLESPNDREFKRIKFAASHKVVCTPLNGGIVKVEEIDETKVIRTLYVDTVKIVHKMALIAFFLHPEEISLQQAKYKLRNLHTDFPNFFPRIKVYNRHGVFVFGENLQDPQNSHSCLWAGADDDHVKRIKCTIRFYMQGEITLKAYKKSEKIVFIQMKSSAKYLNSEVTTII